MLYTIKERDSGWTMGLTAKSIDDVRRWIYWNRKKEGGRYMIYKGKRLLGVMYSGGYWWGYDPDTGYGIDYEVLSNGMIRDSQYWSGEYGNQ